MAARQNEALGWGTIVMWIAIAGIFLGVLVFGVFVPTGGTNMIQTDRSLPPERAQPQQPPGPAR